MKVALVYPNSQKKENQGPGYIASAVMDAGHTLDFYDEIYTPFTDDLVREVVDNHDVVLLSALTLYFPVAVDFAQRVKALCPEMPILLGGLHATVLPDVALSNTCFDYICVGEGEEFIVEFLNKLGNATALQEVANLGYRNDDGTTTINPPRPAQSLDTLPRYRREIYRDESIVHGRPFPAFMYVYASRGCPYRCSYCANQCYLNLYGKKYIRTMDPELVVQELIWLRNRYDVRSLYFGDEMLLANREYCEQLLPAIHSRVRLPYGCMARVEQITPDLVNLFRKTGCQHIGMGVECGDEKYRNEVLNRKMSNATIINAFQQLKHGLPDVSLTAFCMRGWPTPKDGEMLEKTRKLVDQIQPTIRQLNTFFPFPGTKLYDYCVEHDMIDWNLYNKKRNLVGPSVLKMYREEQADVKTS